MGVLDCVGPYLSLALRGQPNTLSLPEGTNKMLGFGDVSGIGVEGRINKKGYINFWGSGCVSLTPPLPLFGAAWAFVKLQALGVVEV